MYTRKISVIYNALFFKHSFISLAMLINFIYHSTVNSSSSTILGDALLSTLTQHRNKLKLMDLPTALTEARNIYKLGNLILGSQHSDAIRVSSLEDMTALVRVRFMGKSTRPQMVGRQ